MLPRLEGCAAMRLLTYDGDLHPVVKLYFLYGRRHAVRYMEGQSNAWKLEVCGDDENSGGLVVRVGQGLEQGKWASVSPSRVLIYSHSRSPMEVGQ